MNAQAIYNLIASNAAIAAEITRGEELLIDWKVKPQDEMGPCLVLSIPDEIPGQSLSGPDGSEEGTLEVLCFAPTYDQAKALSDLVRDELDNAEPETGAIFTVDDVTDLDILADDGRETPACFGRKVSITVES